ncbi:MAG TPA: 4-(cytidine 5'-diphospho)-2-C-methyl-D-erythritol kinase [bacterium]|nr:4-(cytidine 5'-diphospho)-2-C-methyl-D-erythritol kinase [bacterium]
MKELHLNAYAKVNLTLDVIGDRPDGYHDIETVMHTVELHDSIILRESESGITIRCASPDVPADTQNIVYRAAQYLRETFRIPKGVEVELNKYIPIASGLGGGSSDAAVTLLGLAQMWKLRLSDGQLLDLAGHIGSDVPFFIVGGAALAVGRGERIRPLRPLPTTWIVLARPPIQVSTEWAYRVLDHATARRHPDTKAVVRAIEAEDAVQVGRLVCNVFEDVVVAHYPEVAALRDRMLAYKPLGVSLSGTGPVVFALAANEGDARRIGAALSEQGDLEVFVTRTFAEER